MSLKVEPISEADIPAVVETDYAAFYGSSNVAPLVWPNGITDNVYKKGLEMRKKELSDSSRVFMKVVDTNLDGTLIAFAVWAIWEEDQPRSEWDAPEVKQVIEKFENDADTNTALLNEFFGIVSTVKRRYIQGKARIHLSFLATHPDHQRRGAGKMLLDYGAELAEKKGLQSTLFATKVGLPLYLREGFELVDGAFAVLDLQKWGVKGEWGTQLLRRPLHATPEDV